MSVNLNTRQVGDVSVVDVAGRITLGEGSSALRDTLRGSGVQRSEEDPAQSGRGFLHRQLGDRRAGIGIHHGDQQRRELKLLNLAKRVKDLLQITKLYTVFDVHEDEAAAVRSFK